MTLVEKFSGGVSGCGKDPHSFSYKKLVKNPSVLKPKRFDKRAQLGLTPKLFEVAIDDFKNSSYQICEDIIQAVSSRFPVVLNEMELSSLLGFVLCAYLDIKFDNQVGDEYQEILDFKIDKLVSKEIFDQLLLKLTSYESRLPDKMGIKKITVNRDQVFSPEIDLRIAKELSKEQSLGDEVITELDNQLLSYEPEKVQTKEKDLKNKKLKIKSTKNRK